MKRCPKCNRTYTTDTQKFCTHDGVVLEVLGVSQGDTIRIDSVQIDDDAPTKAISRDLAAEVTGGFDPFKTVMSRPEETTANRPRDTQDLAPSTSTPLPTPPPVRDGMIDTSPGGPPPSHVQPTMQLSGSGATSAPLPPPQSAPLPAQPSATPRPRTKKSRLPLVLGILAVLLVLGVGALGAAYYFVFRPMLAARRAIAVEPPRPPANEPTPNVEATPNDVGKTDPKVAPEPPPYSPPADAVEFRNSQAKLDGKLAEHYVDFSFYYPNRWEKDPTAGVRGASNFAKVERRLPPDFTQENFAVGWYSSAGSDEADRPVYHTLAENLSAQFAKNFPEYRKVSEGETKAGVYAGYEFRFEGASRSTAKGDLKLWGRVIFVPPVDGGKNGVTLLMLATSLAPELKTVNDVGVKGELPMMLQSFRFEKK
jgi:hypothetical protein